MGEVRSEEREGKKRERERLLDIAGVSFIRGGIVPIGSADKPRWDGA